MIDSSFAQANKMIDSSFAQANKMIDSSFAQAPGCAFARPSVDGPAWLYEWNAFDDGKKTSRLTPLAGQRKRKTARVSGRMRDRPRGEEERDKFSRHGRGLPFLKFLESRSLCEYRVAA